MPQWRKRRLVLQRPQVLAGILKALQDGSKPTPCQLQPQRKARRHSAFRRFEKVRLSTAQAQLSALCPIFGSNQGTWNFRYFTLDEEGNPEADDPNKLTIDDEDEGFEEFDVDGEVEMDQMDWL